MMQTKIEVVLIVEHDEHVDQDTLHAACDEALPGLTLLEGSVTADGRERVGVAIVDDVETVWVKG